MPTTCPNTTTPPKAIMGIEDNKAIVRAFHQTLKDPESQAA
jgi:hypothetical protein